MKAYRKVILRSITRAKARFAAIFLIVALGAGFFAGISSTAPDMRQTVNRYLDQQHFMDLEIASTLGFSTKDVQAVRSAEGVEAVEATFQEDVYSHLEDADRVIRVHALPYAAQDANAINQPVLLAGRWPKTADECVMDQRKSLIDRSLKMGDTVTVQEPNNQKNMKQHAFRVVGFIRSPLYLSYTLGNTNLGNGQISRYFYVLPQVFSGSPFTRLFIRVKGAAQWSAFTDAYSNQIEPVRNRLTAIGKQRAPLRRSEVTADAQKRLNDGRAAYQAQEAAAKTQLSQAKAKLDTTDLQIAEHAAQLRDAQQKLSAGKSALQNAKKAYQSGIAQFQAQKAQAEQALSAAQKQLQQGQAAAADARQKLTAGQNALAARRQQLAAAEQKLNQSAQQLESGRKALQAQAPAVEQARRALLQLEAAGQGATDQAALLRRQIAAYTAQQDKLTAAERQLQQARQTYAQQAAAAAPQIEAARRQLEQGQSQLAAREKQLTQAESDLRSRQKSVQDSLSAAQKKLQSANAQILQQQQALQTAQAKITTGAAQLQDARTALQKGKQQYETAKAEADSRLSKAAAQLQAGEKQLQAVQGAVWYVLDRSKNIGFQNFTDDANRMQSISRMFPVFFFLVAALVVLTTMARMVEEDRLQIGTYKALGLSKSSIAANYLLYAALVSFSGGLFGVVVGCLSLPTICWNAYRILYTAPELVPHIHPFYASVGCLSVTAIALVSTWAACRAALRERPAALLQPKAPQPGRRILLERIPVLWKRMQFTQKVTARNLLRYRKRFLMTVIGIAGCTALMLTGFGLKDSITNIVTNQYGDLCQYQIEMNLQPSGISKGTQEILNNPHRIRSWMPYTARSADIQTAQTDSMSAILFLPQDPQKFSSMIRLRNRRTHQPIPFGENSVIVTEKLANRLGIKSGSRILVPDSSGKTHAFTVTGITENYIYHYVYISPALYQKVTGEALSVNGIWAVDAGKKSARQQLSRDLLNQSDVSTLVFVDDIAGRFGSMMQALNTIVLVLIFCAGLLSFVVLYNLTNINITERSREMATLRVLGFYERETAQYIYRETTLLTLIGCACGLLLGIFMHRAVITTVEVDMVMFGRTLSPLSYLLSILLTLAFTAAVDLWMYPKFRRINMVESLKSVD